MHDLQSAIKDLKNVYADRNRILDDIKNTKQNETTTETEAKNQ